jgi:S1-C subfamily serine protease
MNALDISIIVLVLAATGFGVARGFWFTMFEYAGVGLGLLAAITVAPPALQRLPIDATGLRVATVVLLLVCGTAIGSALFHVAGDLARRSARGIVPLRVLDQFAGGVVTAVVMLSVVWYAGLVLALLPVEAVAREARQSAILQRLDAVAPPVPQPFTMLERQFSGDLLPQLFAGLEPGDLGGLRPDPFTVDAATVRRAAASTVKVRAPGCGGVNSGSGAVIAAGRVLTNAHVLSGTRSVSVLPPDGSAPLPASVIAFDPARDVAILNVPGLLLAPLSMAAVARGAQVAIVGYPGGGPERVEPAVVQGELRGEGHDIYGRQPVTREILVLSGLAQPGNSGGPLVDLQGRMVGVVFAGSASRPMQSYALALGDLLPSIEAVGTAGGVIDTRVFDCVS